MPAVEAEVVADALWAAGASAVGEQARGGAVVLTTDLDRCPPDLSAWPHDVVADDGAWWDGWRPFARAVAVGPFLVRPPWVAAEAAEFDAVLELVVDAGRAFGTGAHPSTTLALHALAGLARPGATVLDVGCGSGTLAIGAALLGAARVLAVDVDPEAVAAAAANAERNGVEATVEVAAVEAGDVAGEFDVVVANLGAPLVFDLARTLRARCAPGGALVLSGMLGDHAPRVRAAYPGAVVEEPVEADGWTCVVLRPRESAVAGDG